jgi:tetratricopeptide (TPR) repeat protein
MAGRMFKVFLGSTFKDLHEHRAAVQAAINRRDDCKAVVMEEFGARAGRPKEVCLEIVGDCQLYVGLVGHCYGHVPDGEAVSITEAEYEAAVAKGLPRVLFLANEKFTPPAHIRENDEKYRMLQDFRARLMRDETAQWFDNDRGTLAARVGEALGREIVKLPARPAEPVVAGLTFLPRKGSCFGRDEEVAKLCRAVLAEEPEPVVVLGPPGIGKSKVTVAALHDPAVKARFGERRWFVPLETAPEPAAILGQVGLRIGVQPGPELAARVLAALAAGPGLLVLDNTETPWWKDGAGTEAVLERLAEVPRLALVCSVRSQQALRRPEWGTSILVPGLPEAAARELFLKRADERHSASALLPGMLAEMDGVPLAIELLAGHVRADEQSLERIAKAWRDKRTALLAARPDAAHRLDSYEVSLALSLDSERMTEPARTLYALIGRLPAGITAEAADALLSGEASAAMETLAALGLAFDAGDRLSMLAPIREHARRLPLAPEAESALVDEWLRLAEALGAQMGRAGGLKKIAQLTAEWPNVESVAAVGLTARSNRAIDAACGLVGFITLTGVGTAALLARGANVARQLGDDLRWVTCLLGQGTIALQRSDHTAARAGYEAALPLFQKVGDLLGEANCIQGLGDTALARSDHEGARQRYEAALPLYRQVGDVLGEANCIQGLGDIALAEGEPEVAATRFAAALALYRRIPEPYSIGSALVRLARLAEGDLRAERVAEARAAWQSIDRADLLEELERQFGPSETPVDYVPTRAA